MADSPGGTAGYSGYILAQVQAQLPGIVAGQVANQLSAQLGEIQTAITQVKHRMDMADARINQQVELIKANTGSILQEHLTKANDVLEYERIEMATTCLLNCFTFDNAATTANVKDYGAIFLSFFFFFFFFTVFLP